MTRALEILERLIRFPTVSHSSNLDLITWVQNLLCTAGFEVTRIPSLCGTKAGLHARIGPAAAGGICLSGHTDVVPADGQAWTRSAFKMTKDNGRVFGRGTTDMKGFVASALALAERAAGESLRAPLSLVLSYDEEVGCVGIRDMLPALTPLLGQPRLVIVGEPTSMLVATNHKGKASLRVTCKGEAGHSALAPQFLNAIHISSGFISEIRSLQEQLAHSPRDDTFSIPYTTLHIGKISGGRALNIVPDQVTLDMEFRHIPEAAPGDVLEAIRSAGRRCSAGFGQTGLIDVEQVGAYPGLNQTVDKKYAALNQKLVGHTETRSVEFGTEAGYFSQLGLNVAVIGPGDMASDGHQPDEGLDVGELAACDMMMDRIQALLM